MTNPATSCGISFLYGLPQSGHFEIILNVVFTGIDHGLEHLAIGRQAFGGDYSLLAAQLATAIQPLRLAAASQKIFADLAPPADPLDWLAIAMEASIGPLDHPVSAFGRAGLLPPFIRGGFSGRLSPGDTREYRLMLTTLRPQLALGEAVLRNLRVAAPEK